MSSANKAIQMMLSRKSKESKKDEIKVKYTDVHNLIPNEHNTYPMTDIEKLACFIKLSGDITPLTLKPREDGKFIILSGHRRTQAVLYLISQDSNFSPMVPYVEAKSNAFLDFLDEGDRETLAICLPNEGQRRELTAAERAEVLKRLRPVVKKIYDKGDVGTHFRKFFAEFLDMSESQIQRAEAYSKLSESLKSDVDAGVIAPSVAALLVGMNPDEQDLLVQKIRDSGQKITKQTITDFLHQTKSSNESSNLQLNSERHGVPEIAEAEDVNSEDAVQPSSDEQGDSDWQSKSNAEAGNSMPTSHSTDTENTVNGVQNKLNSSTDSKKVKECKECIANYFDILTTIHYENELIDFIDMLRDELSVVKNDLVMK